MDNIYRKLVSRVAIAQEEFFRYGLIHPKTGISLVRASSQRDYSKIELLSKRERQIIKKAHERCNVLIYRTGQILNEAWIHRLWPIPEAQKEDLIPWLESAVSYLDRKIKNHLKEHSFNSFKAAYSVFENGKFEDTLEEVGYYAALSEMTTDRYGYRALLKIWKARQRELEELVRDQSRKII